jgi:hypothetical protein
VSILRKPATQISELRWGFKWLLIHPVAEKPSGKEETGQADDGHGPVLVGQHGYCGPFQKNASQNNQKIAHGIKVCQILHKGRHIGDGVGKSGQYHAGHQKNKGAEKPLLLGNAHGRDHQPDTDG